MVGLKMGLSLTTPGAGGDAPLPFAGNPFPVTLKRSSTEYYVVETGAYWFADYAGATLTVGVPPAAYANLDTAIAAASNGDIISIAPGSYAMPSASISKNLAFIAPAGGVYIGTFADLTAATTSVVGGGVYNITVLSARVAGLIRKSELVSGTRGFAVARVSADQTGVYAPGGIASVFVGGSSTNVSTGTGETLASFIARGELVGWLLTDVGRFVVDGGQVYIGDGITIASNAVSSVLLTSGLLVLDGTSVFGGADQCIYAPTTGTLIQFNTQVAGSGRLSDNISYRGDVIGVEVGVQSFYPGSSDASNASTAHADAQVLRVGGEYVGGSRTLHDVENAKSYTFSSTIRAPLFYDKWGIAWGYPGHVPNTPSGAYGDLTFVGTFTQQVYIDAGATVQEIGLTDPWTLA